MHVFIENVQMCLAVNFPSRINCFCHTCRIWRSVLLCVYLFEIYFLVKRKLSYSFL